MMRRALPRLALALLLGLLARPAGAQPLFTSAFPPEEFAARRARVMAAVGDGVAVLQGAAELPSYLAFRQNNHVFYLTGVEVPRALVLIDGRSKRTTLFLPPRDERMERSEGPILVPGDEAIRLTGIEAVAPRDEFVAALDAIAREGRPIFTPHRGESLGAFTPWAVARHQRLSSADPWDGRASREEAFIARIKARATQAKVDDLDPILDRLRLIKSRREIEAIREATRISSAGILEGMKAARPGQKERELAAVADYVFRKNGAQGVGYFALVAAGKNAHYPHYHGGDSVLQDGEFVLFDYAPDVANYTSDVTRVFPANGRFTPWQREIYTVYLRCYRALMAELKPGRTTREIHDAAFARMRQIVDGTTFADARIARAARDFIALFGPDRRADRVGHWVGMEVHDVDSTPDGDVLKPGMVFTIEPALTITEDRVYIRLEDVIVITETGYENLSESLPFEIADIEATMAAPGLGEPMPSATTARPSKPSSRPTTTAPRSQQP
ncbi:MAG: Xaa-Pro peptidase family protein [Vicinamibacteraceae bacterium]